MKKRRVDFFPCIALLFMGMFIYTFGVKKPLKTQGNIEKRGVCCEHGDSVIEIHEILPLMSYIDSIGELPPTMGRVDTLIQILPVKYKLWTLSQVALESSYTKSGLTRTNANLVAMRVARRRATINNGELYGYATYKNWAYSLLDFALWQNRYMNDLDEQKYLEKLGQIYAEDTNYIKKLKIIKENLEESKNRHTFAKHLGSSEPDM